MNVQFKLDSTSQVLNSYNTLCSDMYQAIQMVKSAKDKITDDVWRGDSKDTFEDTVDSWVQKTEEVLSDILDTRQAVADYANNKGTLQKVKSESAVSCF